MLMDYYVGEQLRRDREAEWEARSRRGEFITDEDKRLKWKDRLRAYTKQIRSSYTRWR